jgi:hypothetical protein
MLRARILGLLILVGCGRSETPPPDVSSSGSSDLDSVQAMCDQIGLDGQCSPDRTSMLWCGSSSDPGGRTTKVLFKQTCGAGMVCGLNKCGRGANCCPAPTSRGGCNALGQCADGHLQYCGVDGNRYDEDCGESFGSGVCIPNLGDQPAFCAAGCSNQQIHAAQDACRAQCAQTPGCTRSLGVKFCSVAEGAGGNGGGNGATGAAGAGGASRVVAPCAFE